MAWNQPTTNNANQPKYGAKTNGHIAAKVPNHMVGAILTTLFCCLIGGIVAMVYAGKVNTRLAKGDVAGAQAASKVAKRWIVASILLVALVPVTGIVMSALFPAISSATRNAQTTAASMRGRNLFVGIVQANADREAAGLPDIWPRTPGSSFLSSDKHDVSGMPFKNATDYFKVLFDTKSYGTGDWSPYLSVDMDVLKLSNDGYRFCDWIVAANVQDEFDDNIPVLISANVDPATLKTSYDGYDNSPIPFGSKVGRTGIPWGDSAVIVIRKGGSAQIIRRNHFTYDTLYNGQKFSAPGLRYLDAE